MTTPNLELAFFTGRLDRIVLNTLNIELLNSASADGAKATITNNIEVGIKSPEADAYFVAITVTVAVTDPKTSEPLCNAKVKVSGFYKLDNAIDEKRAKELAEAAVLRGSYQLYPTVRRIILENMGRAGVGLKEFPYEPPIPKSSDFLSGPPAAGAKTAAHRSRRNKK